MFTGKIAIPTDDPNGLQGQRSDHFGHCQYFTLVALDNGQVQEVNTIDNTPHRAGGCQEVVHLLQEQRVNAVVAAGMGNGPYRKLLTTGIKVLFADSKQYPDVQSVLDEMHHLCKQPFAEQQLCQGNGDCHQHEIRSEQSNEK